LHVAVLSALRFTRRLDAGTLHELLGPYTERVRDLDPSESARAACEFVLRYVWGCIPDSEAAALRICEQIERMIEVGELSEEEVEENYQLQSEIRWRARLEETASSLALDTICTLSTMTINGSLDNIDCASALITRTLIAAGELGACEQFIVELAQTTSSH
jgi:hypothetical protein